MKPLYAQVQSCVKQKHIESGDCSVVWNEITEQNDPSFVGMIQMIWTRLWVLSEQMQQCDIQSMLFFKL